MELIDKPISDTDKTKVCIIEDMAKYIRLHKLNPITPEDFDLLMDQTVEDLERAFAEIKRRVEQANAPPYPL